MNVLISRYCNRRCSFCFARQRLGKNASAGGDTFMTRDNIRSIMTVLKRSGDMILRLLGGEPTLHPEFPAIVQEAIDEGFKIYVFTNGMMQPGVADFIAGLPDDKITLLCNVSPQANDSPRQKELLHDALKKIHSKTRLGITITTPGENFDFLIDHIDRYKLQRRIRVGIAQPIVGQSNDYLKPEIYREAGTYIVSLAEQFYKNNILVGFDCGLTLCMFTEAQIGRLFTITEGMRILCHPIIDIGPDMDIWHCFPLSEVLVGRFDRFQNRNEMIAFYEKHVKSYRALGCKPECMQCKYLRTRQCTGGCLAHAMNALNQKPAPHIA